MNLISESCFSVHENTMKKMERQIQTGESYLQHLKLAGLEFISRTSSDHKKNREVSSPKVEKNTWEGCAVNRKSQMTSNQS